MTVTFRANIHLPGGNYVIRKQNEKESRQSADDILINTDQVTYAKPYNDNMEFHMSNGDIINTGKSFELDDIGRVYEIAQQLKPGQTAGYTIIGQKYVQHNDIDNNLKKVDKIYDNGTEIKPSDKDKLGKIFDIKSV